MTGRHNEEEVGPVRMTRRATAIVTGAALGALLLGGCAPSPGTAAVVDGETITTAEVDEALADLTPILATASPSNVVSLLIISPSFLAAADAAGFGVSEEEGRAYIVAAGLVTEAQAAELSPGALEIVRFAVMQGSVATEADAAVLDEAAARLQESEIDLNPRFGAWDSEALTATALDTPWIVPGG